MHDVLYMCEVPKVSLCLSILSIKVSAGAWSVLSVHWCQTCHSSVSQVCERFLGVWCPPHPRFLGVWCSWYPRCVKFPRCPRCLDPCVHVNGSIMSLVSQVCKGSLESKVSGGVWSFPCCLRCLEFPGVHHIPGFLGVMLQVCEMM